MDHGHFPLTELLLNDGISRVDLCERALCKVVEVLSNFGAWDTLERCAGEKAESVMQYLQTLTMLLRNVESKDFEELGNRCLHEVCVPYLRWLSTEHASVPQTVLATALKTSALVLSMLMEESKVLQNAIISWCVHIVNDELCSQQSFQSGHHEVSTTANAELVTCLVVLPLLQFMLESSTSVQGGDNCFSELFEALLKLVINCDAGTHFFLICSTLLPMFIAGDHQLSRLEKIWDLIKSVHSNKTTVESSKMELVLTLLCCFHDVFIVHDDSSPFSTSFPADLFEVTGSHALLDLRKEDSFWAIVQEGLTSPDPLSRKRCMYLLHCVLVSVQKTDGGDGEVHVVSSANWVFWWEAASTKRLLAVWNDLLLVLETLEEKQVHIVKPVKKHLQSLISATRTKVNGHSLLHISWLMVALSRIFVHHEAKSIIRWGVQETLDMPLEGSPLLMKEHWEFIFGPLLKVLSETAIYGRDPSAQSGSCPPIAESLCKFLDRFISHLNSHDEASAFLTQFLSSCYSIKMADIPLVFVSYALSQLPPQPLFRTEALAGIRSIVLNCLLTHKPSLRAAIQCFLLTAVCNLTDVVQVGCVDVVQTLGCFRSSECLLYNSSPWNQACSFLVKFCTASNTISRSGAAGVQCGVSLTTAAAATEVNNGKEGDYGSCYSLFSFLGRCVANCTREEKDPLLPGGLQVARAILLAVHTEITTSTKVLSTEQRSLAETLTLLVAPFMDLLAGAHTRLYLSDSSVLGSIELLTSLLDQWLQRLVAGVSEEEVEQLQAKGIPASESKEGHSVGKLLYESLLPWLPETMVYIQDRLLPPHQHEVQCQLDVDLQLFDLYASALDHFYRFMKHFGFSFECSRDLGPKCLAQRAVNHLQTICSKQTVQITSRLLGSLTALSWVCTLRMAPVAKEQAATNSPLVTVTSAGDTQMPSSTWQQLPNHRGDHFKLAVLISQLPVNLVVVKPDLPAKPDEHEGKYMMGGEPVYSEEEGRTFKMTAARKKTEWGPLRSHCYSCYWKCVLFALKQLHGTDKGNSLTSGKTERASDVATDDRTSKGSCFQTLEPNLSSKQGGPTMTERGGEGSLIPIGSNDMNAVIEVCLSAGLDLADDEVPAVIECLCVLLPKALKMVDPLSKVVSSTRAIWPFVLEQLDKHHRSFRRALRAFVGLTFHPSIQLRCQDDQNQQDCLIMQHQYIEELHALGEAKSGVFNVLVTHVCDTWLECLVDYTQTAVASRPAGYHEDSTVTPSPSTSTSKSADPPGALGAAVKAIVASMKAHTDLVIMAATFGPVHKKNIRMVRDVEGFIESAAALGATPSSGLLIRFSDEDKGVRVCVVNFLMKLVALTGSSAMPLEIKNLLDDFLHNLAVSLTKKLVRISVERPRYYINSATHRTKLRLVQCLIIATTRINKVTAALITEQLLSALQYDNQLSVRYLIEWQTVLLLKAYPELIDDLFLPCLNHDSEKRLSRMCSIFTIAVHVGLCLKETADKEAYYLRAFPAVYQWTSSYHFIVRLYSQQAVFRMWEEFRSLPSLLQHIRMLESLVSFMKQNGDGSKFQHKIRENYFFTMVKADADVSIETLFYTLPCLCRVTEEELISPELFEVLGMELWNAGIGHKHSTDSNDTTLLSPVKLRCTNPELLSALGAAKDTPLIEECGSDTRSISHHLKSSGSSATADLAGPKPTVNNDTPAPPESSAALAEGDVQKKITPWTNPGSVAAELFPGSTILSNGAPRLSSQSRNREGERSGLVLVASLLNKIPNLGGLARTCEIFGVSELVLSNIKVLEEKQFQSLSVTAEKWLSITEVKLPSLHDYLLTMRRKGYALVGAEQTANSKDIVKFSFKPNTVLVLGNEREGIPVPIIHLLDSCVEIPQFGMIRSLNAHVSGALLVWEYVKQYFVEKRESSRTNPTTLS